MKGWCSMSCKLTWKMKATKYKRTYFLLQASALRTCENGFSLLRSPAAQEPGIRVERLVTKDGQPAKICYMGHALMENRHGLVIDGGVRDVAAAGQGWCDGS
jgi:hypothetical protein